MSSLLCGEHKSLSVHEMWNRVNRNQRKPLSILIYATLHFIHPECLDSYALQEGRPELRKLYHEDARSAIHVLAISLYSKQYHLEILKLYLHFRQYLSSLPFQIRYSCEYRELSHEYLTV